jgi:hypothetical protein
MAKDTDAEYYTGIEWSHDQRTTEMVINAADSAMAELFPGHPSVTSMLHPSRCTSKDLRKRDAVSLYQRPMGCKVGTILCRFLTYQFSNLDFTDRARFAKLCSSAGKSAARDLKCCKDSWDAPDQPKKPVPFSCALSAVPWESRDGLTLEVAWFFEVAWHNDIVKPIPQLEQQNDNRSEAVSDVPLKEN